MRAKSFFYVCAGVFLLALSYHFGATSAGAQAPGNPVVGIASGSSAPWVATANGDTYARNPGGPWTYTGNVFVATPTSTTQETWGGVKARYR